MIVNPRLSSFGNTLGIQDRKIKGAVFVPNKSNYANLFSLESTLNQLKFLNIVGWFTYEKGYQRGSLRVKKIFDLYTKKGIDIIICYSREDLLEIESYGCPIYCIKESTMIKGNKGKYHKQREVIYERIKYIYYNNNRTVGHRAMHLFLSRYGIHLGKTTVHKYSTCKRNFKDCFEAGKIPKELDIAFRSRATIRFRGVCYVL